jgi:3-oxoacyl-[acyl-carrier-protein] synthase II
MDHAIERGANILCELRGYGLSGDAYHVTSPDPDGKGAERAIRMALERAGLEPGDVDYVNAHATSTPMGDEIEERIINKVLCDEDHRTNDLHVSSTKGATGHLLGAAGAMEAAITVNAIVKGLAPQSRNLNKESPKGFFKHIIDSPESKDINVAINNSFGFGGTNACLVFASAPPTVASTKNSSL